MPDRSVTVEAELAVSPARLAAVLRDRGVWIRTAVALGHRVDAHPSSTGPVADGDLLRVRRGDRAGARSLILQASRADPSEVPAWTVLAGPGAVTGLSIQVAALPAPAPPAADAGDAPAQARITVRWDVRRGPGPVPHRWPDRSLTAAGRMLIGIVEVTARAPRLVVAAAILRRVGERTELLVARVPSGEWELPGGKVEPRESEAEALRREIAEELGVRVTPGHRVGRPVQVGDGLELRCWTATVDPGEPSPQAIEHTQLRWVGINDLDAVVLRTADEAWREDLRQLLAAPPDRSDAG